MYTDDRDSFLSMDNLNVVKEEEKVEEKVQEKVEEVIVQEDALVIPAVEKEIEKPEYANKQFEANEDAEAPSSESKDSSSNLSVFADYLKEEGVLSAEIIGENKIDSIEDLKNLVMKQIEAERHSNLSEGQLRYLESIESGVPLNEYEAMEKEIHGLESISAEQLQEDGQLRFDIMVTDLMASGLSEEKSVAMAQRSFDSGKDLEDAQEAIQSLYEKRVEAFRNSADTHKERSKVDYETVKNLVESKESLMGDIQLSKEDKSNLLKVMTTQVGADEYGNPMNQFAKWRMDNGVEAEIILNALFVNTNGFKDMGDIKTQIKSSSAKELERRLKSLDAEEMNKSLQQGNQSVKGMRLQ